MEGVTLEKLQVVIEAYTKPYRDELEKVKRQTGAVTAQVEKQTGKMSQSFKKVGIAVASVVSVGAIAAFAKSCVKLGSDLQEVQNVVDVTFGDMNRQVDAFAKNAIAKFGLSELTAKKYMGSFGAMAKSFGFDSRQTYEMSSSLAGLVGDVASFYNINQDDAYAKLSAVFTSETEALKHLGVVMTQTALDQYALNNGFGRTTAKMTEQEKVMLRYRFVMDSLSDASGDFARTSGSWANQVRVLALQFESLKATIGQGLINAFTPIIGAINTLLAKLQTLANYFKAFTQALFGKSGGGNSAPATAAKSMARAAGSSGAVADNMDRAAGAAKKMKEYTLGIDELNVLSPDDADSGGSGGGDGGGAPDFGDMSGELFGNVTVNPEIDAALERMQNLLARLKELAKPTTDAIKRLWNEGLARLGKFTWTALEDFYRNFLVPMGTWMLGEEGLPRFFNITNALLNEIDWGRLNGALADLFTELQKPAKFVWTGLMDFYAGFLKPVGVWALGEGLPRLLDVCSRLLSAINWDGLNSALRGLWDALGPFAVSVGDGLVSFVEALAKALTPVLSTAVDALSLALKGIGAVVRAIPADAVVALGGAIGGLTTALLVFKGMDMAIEAIGKIKRVMGDLLLTIADNPILMIVGALSSLAGAFMALEQHWSNQWAQEYAEFQREIGSNTGDLQAAADALGKVGENSERIIADAEAKGGQLDILAQSYFELAEKTSLTAGEQELLKLRADELTKACGDLEGMIDKTTGRYTAQKAELEKVIQKQKEYYEVLGLQQVISEYAENMGRANVELAEAEKQYDDNVAKMKEWLIIEGKVNGAHLSNEEVYRDHRDLLTECGFAYSDMNDMMSISLDQYNFYLQAVEESEEAQKNAKKALEDASAAFDTANSMLSQHAEKYRELDDVTTQIDFGAMVLNATQAIDSLGGVFVNGKQVVGEEAVRLYQTIIDSYGTTDQDMYNLGAKGVVQFGLGGKEGIPDAVGTMTGDLQTTLEGWYTSQGYQGHYDAGKYVVEGYNTGIADSTGLTQEAYRKWLEDGDGTITDYWQINSPSKKAQSYGEYVVLGFNQGISDNSETTHAAVSEWVQNIGTWFTQGLDESLPSTEPFGQQILNGIMDGFRAGYGDWTSLLDEWYTSYVSPWFTDKAWSELFTPIKTQLQGTWTDAQKAWQAGINAWWAQDVQPKFTAPVWKTLYEPIKTQLQGAWKEAWEAWKSDLSTWWTEDVETYFEVERWETMLGVIQNLNTKWGEAWEVWTTDLGRWWTEDVESWFTAERWITAMQGIPQAFATVFKDAANSARNVLNKLIDYLNTLEITIPEFEVEGETFGGDSFKAFSIPRIPELANGGLVSSGQLFLAREAGPELVGSYGGKTGVLNNKQIVDAVSEGVAVAVADVLSSQGQGAPERIEVNLVVDGRTLANTVADVGRRSGFKFRPA